MGLKEMNAALDEVGSEGSIAKALENLSDFIAKSGEKWAPSGTQMKDSSHNEKWAPRGTQMNNSTKQFEPSVGKKPKSHASMGGAPEAKRVVSEDENMGGYDDLDEPEEGASRIRAARNNGKGKVPTSKVTDLGRKSLRPTDEDDFQQSAGDASDDAGDEDGDGDAYADEDETGPQDGDEQVDPQLAQLLMALQQNPQLMQVLMAVLGGGDAGAGGGAPDDGGGDPAAAGAPPEGDPSMGGGAPPAAADPSMGGGAPPPAGMGGVPPHTHDAPGDPRLQRSMQNYTEALQKGYVNDSRSAEIAEAMDASPVLEALIDQNINAFAKCLAKLDKALSQQAEQAKRLEVLEEGVYKSMVLQAQIAKSFEAPVAKSKGAVRSAPPSLATMPSPGVFTPFGKSMSDENPQRAGDIDKRTLSKSLTEAAREGDKDAARLMSFVSLPDGVNYIREHASDSIWKRYSQAVSESN